MKKLVKVKSMKVLRSEEAVRFAQLEKKIEENRVDKVKNKKSDKDAQE